MSILRQGEYVGHEVYFPDDYPFPPQEVIDRLKHYGFIQSDDGFYIPREAVETFKVLAHPHKVDFLQPNIILGGHNHDELMNQALDMINALKKAGVNGIDKWIEKLDSCL